MLSEKTAALKQKIIEKEMGKKIMGFFSKKKPEQAGEQPQNSTNEEGEQ